MYYSPSSLPSSPPFSSFLPSSLPLLPSSPPSLLPLPPPPSLPSLISSSPSGVCGVRADNTFCTRGQKKFISQPCQVRREPGGRGCCVHNAGPHGNWYVDILSSNAVKFNHNLDQVKLALMMFLSVQKKRTKILKNRHAWKFLTWTFFRSTLPVVCNTSPI